MPQQVEMKEVLSRIQDIVNKADIPGRRRSHEIFAAEAAQVALTLGTIYVEYDLAFAANVTLAVRFDVGIEGPVEIKVDVNCPSINSSILFVAGFVELLDRVTKLGLLIQLYCCDKVVKCPFPRRGDG